MVHIIPVGRNQAYCFSALYFSRTDQFGRIFNSIGGIWKAFCRVRIREGKGPLEKL